MAPTYEYHYWVDEDRIDFIDSVYGKDVLSSFMKLKIGAAQADYWRMLVLYRYGGVYMDIDAAFCFPPALFLSDSQQELFIRHKGKPVTNSFIAASSFHSVIKAISDKIKINIDTKKNCSIFEITGPIVVDSIVAGSTCKIELPNRVCKQGIFVQKKYQYPDKSQLHWVEEEKNKKYS